MTVSCASACSQPANHMGCYALSACPLGALSDRLDRKRMLGVGFATAMVADIILAAAANLWIVMTGVALWVCISG